MRKLLLSMLLWAGFGLLVSVLVAFNAVLVWVATGPRDLKDGIPYIEEALAPPGSDYSVKIGQGMLLWNGWLHPLDIRLRDLDVLTQNGTRFASFPDVSLGLDFLSLVRGKVVPTALTVRKPVISLLQSESGEVSFGLPRLEHDAQDAGPPATTPDANGIVLIQLVDELMGKSADVSLDRLKKLEIVDADVSIGSRAEGILLKADHVSMKISRTRRLLRLRMAGVVPQAEGGSASLQSEMSATLNQEKRAVQGRIQWQNLYPSTMAPLFHKEKLNGVNLPLSGWLTFNQAGEPVPRLQYMINAGAGEIRSALLAEPLSVVSAQVEGTAKVGQQDQEIVINKLAVQMPGTIKVENRETGPVVSGSAQIHVEKGDAAIKGNLEARYVLLSDVGKFWPPALSPQSRDWVVTNITGGMVTEAALAMHIGHGDLKKPFLPEDAIDARITFEKGEVRFLPDHAPARQLEGSVFVNGKSLRVEASKGTYLANTRLSDTQVSIDDLNVDNPRIEVTLAADSTANDAIEFLSHPPTDLDKKLKVGKEGMKGSVQGKAHLGFYYEAPRDEKGNPREDMGVDYDVSVRLKEVSAPGLLGKFDIENATGDMKVNNSGMTYSGTGTVNSVPAEAEVRYLFRPEDGFDTFIKARGTAPVPALKRFGYPELPFLSGALTADIDLKQGPSLELAKADVDLKEALLTWKEMGWQKPPGKPASLAFTTRKQNGVLKFESFTLKTEDGEAVGSLRLTDAMDGIRIVHLDRLRLEETDLDSLNYEAIPGGFRLDAKGKTADIRGWMQGSDAFTFTGFPALDIRLDVDRLIMTDKGYLEKVKGLIECGGTYCSRADFNGRAEGKAFSFRIAKGQDGNRTLHAQAEEAGSFLRALDIYDGMRGGALTLSGTYSDSADSHVLNGRLQVTSHTITDAPILARLLSLASITGIPSLISGQGITFNKLDAPFTLEKDVITLDGARTYGSSIGLSADGTITFPGKVLDIKGAIAPAYALNSGILSKIPLIGEAITGGGEGVIAARYSVTGKPSDPDVSVNPLSVLTPGFLRGIFNVFDGKPKKPGKPHEAVQPSEE